MIKIDVISGFLGAGKTTLIKKLFEAGFNGERVVLIENEFGEIGIDGGFLKESGVEIKEINAGCICCSLVGDFATSMKEVINTYNPERIIVEPSGVGKLSDIVNAITKVDAPLQLNILATVVDGPKTKMYLKNFGEFFINQVDAADTIIVSKVDKMSDDKIEEVVSMIKEKNSHANIITTSLKELDGAKLINILEEKVSLKDELINQMKEEYEHHHHDDEECDDPNCCCHHHHDEDEEEHECCHHHHHDEDEEDEHECCHHHHHDEDEEEHECCHHHHHDEDEEEHECCHHHHHDEDEEDEHKCCHHHHHDEDEECDDPDCCCHHHHHDEDEHEHHHHHHHGHDADEVFTSWGMETASSISEDELNRFLNVLATDESLGIIVRAKGILKASDKDSWYYFDFVSGDYEIRTGEADYTGRLCVIGSKIDEHKIESIFKNKEY